MRSTPDAPRRRQTDPIPIRAPGRRASTSGGSTASGASDSGAPWSSSPAAITRSFTESIHGLQTRYSDWKHSTKAFRKMRLDSVPRDNSSDSLSSTASAPPTVVLEPLEAIVSDVLLAGEPMLKVTQNKVAQRTFSVDTESAAIVWASKKNNKVPLYAIRDVRFGAEARSYRQSLQIADSHEPLWISVIYQTPKAYKAVHLIALSSESLQRWRETLLGVMAQRQALISGRVPAASTQSHWLNASWQEKDAKLTLDDVAQLCQRTGIQCSHRELKAHFEAADTQKKGVLNFEAFQHFVASLKRRVDVEHIFQTWADQETISLDVFCGFLRQEQRESWSDEQVAKVYERHASPQGMGYDQFLTYLLSRDNASGAARTARRTASRYRPAASDEGDYALTLPLSDYFISSSHNTYLVGGQWKGDSTVEGYVRALQQGARSVELDCWDGPNGQPQVTHGRTLTGKVPFDDVVAAIAQYAFVSSPYPLILSLEVHNDVQQQEAIASILRTRLGAMLVTAPLDDMPRETLPSPEELRGRVLVKFKDWGLIHMLEHVAEPPPESPVSTTDYTESEGDSLLDQARGIVRHIKRPLRKEPPAEHAPMSDSLTALLVYTIGVRCRGINKKEHYAPEHMFSLSERKALRIIRTNNTDLVKHNVTHLTRVYPSLSTLSRLHSSSANFLPIDMWAAGCQLVALNWQTRDRGMEMNQAFFAYYSGGYRLKPAGLRERALLKNGPGAIRVSLHLTIVSAQQLPPGARDEETNVYIALSAHTPLQWGRAARIVRDEGIGASPRLGSASFRTASASSALAPMWNARCTVQLDLPAPLAAEAYESDELRTVTRGLLDLCFLRFQVYNEHQGVSNALASSTTNLGTLSQGFRHLPLYDTQLSRLLYATLFVHTQYTLERVE